MSSSYCFRFLVIIMSAAFMFSCAHRADQVADSETLAKTFFHKNGLKIPKKLHIKGEARLKSVDGHHAFSGRALVDFIFEKNQCHWEAEVRDPLGIVRGNILMSPPWMLVQEKNSNKQFSRKYDESFSGLPIEGLACWVLGILLEESWSKFSSLQAVGGELGHYEINGVSLGSERQKDPSHYRAELKDWFVVESSTGFEMPRSINFQQVRSGAGVPEVQLKWHWTEVEVITP